MSEDNLSIPAGYDQAPRSNVKYVKYVCPNCKAEDTDKLFDNEQAAPAINCWNCGAGRGKDIGQMLHSRSGMFPVAMDDNSVAA